MYDEELARPAETGRLIHQVIATTAAKTLTPTPHDIHRAVAAALPAFRPIEARAHRQTIASGVFAYFRFLLPPRGWSFDAAEFGLETARLDLVWQDSAGRYLVDEIKTGHSRQLDLTRTSKQVATYLDCASRAWGDRLAGLRLLSTSDPTRSKFIHPDGVSERLDATCYRKAI